MGVTAVVGVLAAGSLYEQDRARSDQKKANKEKRAVARAQALRERQQQIRQARIARAQAVNQAYTSGGQGSILSGAKSSIGSQLGGNLAFNQGTLQRSENAAMYSQRAANHMFASSAFGTAASLFAPFADKRKTPTQRPNTVGAERDVNNLVKKSGLF